jgi:hypothetical protein
VGDPSLKKSDLRTRTSVLVEMTRRTGWSADLPSVEKRDTLTRMRGSAGRGRPVVGSLRERWKILWGEGGKKRALQREQWKI